MGISPLTFTGVSSFSDDFQTISQRATSIASLPVQWMQNEQQNLSARKSALTDLRTAMNEFSAALRALSDTADGRALSLSSSSTKVSASMTANAAAGVFTVDSVTTLASAASATSRDPFASGAPVALEPARFLQFVADGTAHDLILAEGANTLEGVRDAVNALDAGYTASIVEADGGSYLTIAAQNPGAQTIELRTQPGAPASDLLSQTLPGSDAVLSINGKTVTRKSNTIADAIPGVSLSLNSTFELQDRVTLTISSGAAPVLSAVKKFVSAYNKLADRLDKLGGAGSALAGDPALAEARVRLRGVASFIPSSGLAGLAEIGLEFDKNGVLSLKEDTFSSFANGKLPDVFRLLGSSGNGLGSLVSKFDEFTGADEGILKVELESIDTADRRLNGQIEQQTERIRAMQIALQSRLQAADAMLARLESQRTILDASIQSLQLVLFGKKDQS
jgi:flagellar hook-associated protein 2